MTNTLRRLTKAALARAGLKISRLQQQDNGGQQQDMQRGIGTLRRSGLIPNTILDVGASDGRWAALAIAAFPAASLVLFEPQPVHAEALRRFRATHAAKEMTIISSAVGSRVGTTYFDASDPFGGALHDSSDGATIEVPITTLDVTVSTLQLRPPYLVKLDTHGYEFSILEGAKETLPRSNGLIIEAYNHRISKECLLFWELCAYLAERSFRPIDMVDVSLRPYDQTLWQMDIVFARSTWTGFAHNEY